MSVFKAGTTVPLKKALKHSLLPAFSKRTFHTFLSRQAQVHAAAPSRRYARTQAKNRQQTTPGNYNLSFYCTTYNRIYCRGIHSQIRSPM